MRVGMSNRSNSAVYQNILCFDQSNSAVYQTIFCLQTIRIGKHIKETLKTKNNPEEERQLGITSIENWPFENYGLWIIK